MENFENKSFKILIVDDIYKNIQLLGNILVNVNYDISYATSGEEALEIIKNNNFDLILLDIMMPGMNGFSVCENLKTNTSTKEIPIIFITAKNDSLSISKAFQLGGNDYITKPFDSNELLARVKTQIELRHKTLQLQKINYLLEEKVNIRTQQLTNANKRLSKLDKAKNDFLILINHELRTPLNGIRGFTYLLKENFCIPQIAILISDLEKMVFQHFECNFEIPENLFRIKKQFDNVNEKIKKSNKNQYLDYIHESTEKLIKLSELILLITTLRADAYKINVEKFNVPNFLFRIIENNKINAEEKNITIKTEIENPDLEIKIDPNLFTKCLNIILDNAIRYSPKNENIIIRVCEENKCVKIEIEDNGNGFSEDILNQIFDFFISDEIQHHTEGFGLGLAIAKLIMDTFEGEISVKNKKEKGAIVSLFLKSEKTSNS